MLNGYCQRISYCPGKSDNHLTNQVDGKCRGKYAIPMLLIHVMTSTDVWAAKTGFSLIFLGKKVVELKDNYFRNINKLSVNF